MTSSRDGGAPLAARYSYRGDPRVPKFLDDRPLIVFDGCCVMCCGWARFVLRHDAERRFRFLPAQSPLGAALYAHFGLDPHDYETHILIADGVAYLKSEAGIRMAEGLGFPWSLAGALRIVPRPVRDRIYDWLARNRLRVFGRRDSCYVPAADERERFLT
jgi:predicted DCC family thiol-disulfide oxidoreductase YuxK